MNKGKINYKEYNSGFVLGTCFSSLIKFWKEGSLFIVIVYLHVDIDEVRYSLSIFRIIRQLILARTYFFFY